MNSNDTQSTEDSTIITMNKSKISVLKTKIPHVTESQSQHKSDYQYSRI